MKNQINLGQLISLLEQRDEDDTVVFDFAQLIPTTINSYRGYYDQLALGWKDPEYNDPGVTVVSLLALLREAIGKTYVGYKGGNYIMDLSTPLWVSNYGSASGTAITGLVDVDYMTVIETGYL